MTQYMQEAGAMKQADEQREAFETAVFNRRFRASIRRNPNPPKGFGGLDFISTDCPTQAELCKRDGDDYADETVSAMWWGWQAALAAALPPAAVQPPEFQEVSWGVDATMRPIKGLAVSDYSFRQWAKDVGITLAASEGTLTAGKQGGAPMNSEPTK